MKRIGAATLAAVLGAVLASAALTRADDPELCQGVVPTITLSNGNDNVNGTSNRDVILAKAGNDPIHG